MSLCRPTNWFEKEIALFLWKVTPACRSMIRLISDAMDRPLPWRKRVTLYLHRKICVGCGRYHDQLHFTQDAIHGLEIHLDEVRHDELTPDAKVHLKHALHHLRD